MAFGSFDKDDGAPMADINTTPLVDVMLVLLVVFIMTAPLLSNSVKLDLPQAQAASHQDKPDQIRISIDAEGRHFWNDEPVEPAQLAARFARAAQANPQVELHLRADKSVRYELVAQAVARAQQGGIARIGFVTQPESR